MKNHTIIMAIALGLVLTFSSPTVVPHFANAQGCKDASGRPVECPPAPEQSDHKKKPSPTKPRDYKTATPTPTPPSTPTMASTVTLTPIKVPVVPILPGGDGAADSASGWPFSFGSDTTRMLFDGDEGHNFSGLAGILGLLAAAILGFMGIKFVLTPAARIKFEKFDGDTTLVFDKHGPENGQMPLLSEIGFPEDDGAAKDSSKMNIDWNERPEARSPGSADINADAFAEPITGGDELAKPHVDPDRSGSDHRRTGDDD